MFRAKALPKEFAWLLTAPVPPMLKAGLAWHGLDGRMQRRVLVRWAHRLGGSDFIEKDRVPWCGLFMQQLVHECELAGPGPGFLYSKTWLRWGDVVEGQPKRGDLLVFMHEKGQVPVGLPRRHVGLCVEAEGDSVWVLSGSHNNQVSIHSVPLQFMAGARRP